MVLSIVLKLFQQRQNAAWQEAVFVQNMRRVGRWCEGFCALRQAFCKSFTGLKLLTWVLEM